MTRCPASLFTKEMQNHSRYHFISTRMSVTRKMTTGLSRNVEKLETHARLVGRSNAAVTLENTFNTRATLVLCMCAGEPKSYVHTKLPRDGS